MAWLREIDLLVFPAWAGMNRAQADMKAAGISVPRVGGDEPAAAREAEIDQECSPRGRG